MTAPLLILQDVRARRLDGARRFVLRASAFQMTRGDRMAVIAPSGSGKSTFIETVACARAPESAGRFVVQGADNHPVDVAAAWRDGRESRLNALRAKTFGYVQQSGGLLEFLTVRQNIALSQQLSGRRNDEWLRKLAQMLEIDRLLDSYPAKLSGGQRQRVAVARALAHTPSIVIADEPTASLDRVTAQTVMGLLATATEAAGAALLVATHDVALAKAFDFQMIGLRSAAGEDGVEAELIFSRRPATAPAVKEAE
jgi:putative ABC transport system ATP-binding protein